MTIRHRALLLALAGVLTASQRVTAQTRVIQSGTTDSGFAAGDVAYDPKHDVYLFVYERCPWFNNHCPQGRIISGDGTTYGSGPFEIGTSAPNGGGQVSAVYSPDLSDGQGGTGAFLVAWTTWDTDLVWRVYARVISLNGPVAPKIVVNEWRAGTPEGLINAAVAYSSTDRTFLVGWIVIFDYYKSGFYRDIQPYYVRLDVNGQPIGPMRAVNLAHDSPCFSATFGTKSCGALNITWNSVSREFGLLYDDAALVFFRIRADGSIASRTEIGPGWISHAIGVSARIGSYVVAYTDAAATLTVEIDHVGTISGSNTVLPFGVSIFDDSQSAMSYSAATHTHLLDVAGKIVELDEHGVPISPLLSAGPAFAPAVVTRTIAAEWVVTTAGGFGRIMSGTPAVVYVRGDVSGDGVADLIGQDPASGAVQLWAMNGTVAAGPIALTSGGTYWQLVGAADLTGDKKTDLIWQYPGTGDVLVWEMDGMSYVRSILLGPGGTFSPSPAYWHIVAAADFTGDGKADILWQRPVDGRVLLWQMNGTNYVQSTVLNSGSTYWQVVGTGEFTGDGQTDILWQHPSTGALLLWQMSGANYVNSILIGQPGTLWRVVAVGDYTQDGQPDIVWQAPWDGSVLLWTMNGTAYVASTLMAGSATWQIKGPR